MSHGMVLHIASEGRVMAVELQTAELVTIRLFVPLVVCVVHS